MKLLKILLSPLSNFFIGFVIILAAIFSYKFFIIYCMMAPFAIMLAWSYHKDLGIIITLPDGYDGEIHSAFYVIPFILNCMFWVNTIIRYSRIVFFPEEKKNNV
jgi:hypothetical protein